MTTTIIDKALRRVAADVAALIEEHADAIRAAISNQMLITAEEDDEAKLVFSLGIASKIKPKGTEAEVSTTIAWAVKEKKVTYSTVSDQPELPLEVTLETSGRKVTFGKKREGKKTDANEMTEAQTEALLDRAEEAFPDSDYVASVREWFNEKGFITEAQEEALAKIADR